MSSAGGSSSGTGGSEGTTEGDSGNTENDNPGWLGTIGNYFTNLFNKTSDIFKSLGEGFINLINSIGNFFGELFTKLGNWFSELGTNIGTFFSDLGASIGSLFSQLFTDLGNFFNSLWDWLSNLWESIKSIPSSIWNLFKEGLIWLFVPEDNYFNNKVEEFKTALNEKIPYQQYIQSLKDIESVSDVTGDTDEITLGIDLKNYSILDKFTVNMNKFIDFSIFSKFKSTWYSWIRVVVYIGLVIYNINQTVKFLRGFGISEGSIRDIQNNVSSKEGVKK